MNYFLLYPFNIFKFSRNLKYPRKKEPCQCLIKCHIHVNVLQQVTACAIQKTESGKHVKIIPEETNLEKSTTHSTMPVIECKTPNPTNRRGTVKTMMQIMYTNHVIFPVQTNLSSRKHGIIYQFAGCPHSGNTLTSVCFPLKFIYC